MFVKFLKIFYDVTVRVSASLHPTSPKAFHDIVGTKAELDDLFHNPLDYTSSETDKVLFRMAMKMRNKYKNILEPLMM